MLQIVTGTSKITIIICVDTTNQNTTFRIVLRNCSVAIRCAKTLDNCAHVFLSYIIFIPPLKFIALNGNKWLCGIHTCALNVLPLCVVFVVVWLRSILLSARIPCSTLKPSLVDMLRNHEQVINVN